MWPSNQLLSRYFWRSDVLLWLSLGCLHFSPALSSICLGLFVVQLLLMGDTIAMPRYQRVGFFILSMALLWNLLCLYDSVSLGWITQSFVTDRAAADLQKLALVKIQVKLPFCIVLGLFAAGRRLPSVLYSAWPVLVLPLLWIAVSSVIHYWQHRAFYDQMVLESKPIPLYSNVYHIEFAVMVGVVVLLMLYGLLNEKIRDDESQRWLIAALVVLVVCMHILGARTGLVTLYVGGLVMMVQYVKEQRAWLRRAVVTGLLLAMVLSMLPSVQNRVVNTWVDLKTTLSGGDVTHQSFGQRWVAWMSACHVLQNKERIYSGFGVGTDEVMKQAYRQGGVALAERHRIGVHNQWLEGALQCGWIPMLLLLGFGFSVLRRPSGEDRVGGHALWLALAVAMMFESLMERQAGILILLVVFQGLMSEKNGMNSKIKKEYALNDKIK